MSAEVADARDGDLLPPEDCCTGHGRFCGLPRAAHVGWREGGPSHEYCEPEGKPNPDRFVSAHIQTDWTCSHCDADCDVWGVADGWMECSECGRYSFLVPFMTKPLVEVSRDIDDRGNVCAQCGKPSGLYGHQGKCP